ncbi:crotonase/enoyl-CoA hydratase family protein [Halieaceae bacterium IMCC14734]|uniref:Crotonase/enoyl-CoA hydratase family protein n=1 Tax=Candidatus Litorirhabdus singularis TaxID=2518993 RepID=A0ABT3THB0_9GAMM|nr:crotonase/enoyl-CoA hydratase family protein [Candidatus Litorirhabdus singularis]MCX2981716.1 crotonase/enoyl-CoA hydratase family protein [Candidatus Litorirhabdus singularis]
MTIPQYQTLSLCVSDGVAEVALNRPTKANSMNAPMWRELQDCFEWIDQAPEVRVAVLSGNGKHFCSGLDLTMFAGIAGDGGSTEPARRAEALRRTVLRMQDNLSAIEQCRVPVLAAIHNTCIGGAIDLTCCCDMRYCSADAWFGVKEIELGMVADVGTLQRLPRLIGDGMVRELAYTGRRFEADEALRIGFVNRVFPNRDELLDGVMGIARDIAAKSPLAIRGSKEMIVYGRDHSVSDGLNYIATWNAAMLSQQDLLGTIQAQANGESITYED